MKRLAILDDYQTCALKLADWVSLRDRCDIKVFNDHLPFGESLIERLRDFDILCVMRERTPFPRALLESLPQLELLVTSGKRNAAIDVAAANSCNIKVAGTNSPGHATAELTLALILDLARGLTNEYLSVRNGGWQTALGRDLHGAVLGVLGLGRLGSRVAKLAQAFGMQVQAWSHNLTESRAVEQGVRFVDMHTLFSGSDFLTIHLRLSERTRELVGREELRLMRSTAYLINTSRGPIIDEDALVEALENNWIAGAGIDVYNEEPLSPEHRLRTVSNLLCTPHIGYVTEHTYRVFYTEMVDIVDAYLRGEPIPELP